mmetsp:Transcript_106900/g.212279  ORF Transcript_106900/g.212279 Transcript_106900/m.212279 type:complete len:416 (+) Transcript_106900:43-1290(+)
MAEGEPPAVYLWIVLVVLNMLSGIFSGLNLGLMSLAEDDLILVINSSTDPKEVRDAKKILPVRKHGNLLLCTLLIGNTLVNVMLSILTDPIWTYLFGKETLGKIFALALPTALIVVFGEILPQSACSRYALRVGAITLPLTYVFMVVCFPVAWPISLLLDKLLGAEPSNAFTRKSLLVLFRLNALDPETDMTQDDLKILGGALEYKDHPISQVMTPVESVFCLPDTAIFDHATILEVLKHGHTRIPVYHDSRENIIAVFFCKDILGIDFNHALPITEVLDCFDASHRIRKVSQKMKLNEAFNICKTERIHLLVVVDEQAEENSGPQKTVGIVTVEDIVEDIIQEELVDEDDEYVDAAQNKYDRSGTTSSRNLENNTNERAYDTGALLKMYSPDDVFNGASIELDETSRPTNGCCK